MNLNSDTYVPALQWRLGEYQALLRLADQVKDRIAPFITIPEIGFDFEEWRPKKSAHDHVLPFPDRYKSKWGKRSAWVGVHENVVQNPMDDRRHIFTYVFDELRSFKANAIPAIPIAADTNTVRAIAAIVKRDRLGVAISVRLEDLMKQNPGAQVQRMASTLGVGLSAIDVIVDLGAPNFEPYDAFSSALIVTLRRLGDLQAYRNLVLIGTAMPETFRDVAKGVDEIPRHDWLFYKTLVARLPSGMRRLNFGDYTIVHPKFKALDMRLIKPAGKLVYTTRSSWMVCKGGAFRENPKQMHDHCENLVNKGIFKGPGYSRGDNYIAKCALRQVGPSNQTRWKDVAINHHITHVVKDDLSTLGGTP